MVHPNVGSEDYAPPSIGIIGEMYFDNNKNNGNNRIKFFSEGIVAGSDIEHSIREAADMMHREGATRINARFLEGRECYQKNLSYRATQGAR